jgi:hypothetical protein
MRSCKIPGRNEGWIVAKGIAFLAIAVVSATPIFLQSPSLLTTALLALLVWAAFQERPGPALTR